MSQEPKISAPLLKWYDAHRRVLPWRALPGQQPNPYAVWLSEIMLQQTTVATVGPYYHKFLKRWPTVEALAKASLDEVLAAWAGLGYYSRARNLHACARAIVADHKGVFPRTESGLLALPGIGPYTAAAIAAIAFDQPANVVDGNVERVMARLFTVKTPLPKAKPELKQLAHKLLPSKRAGDYAQALMDLGATTCTPRAPDCPSCPLRRVCTAYKEGTPALYPKRERKKPKPFKQAIVFVLTDGKGRYWMQRRPERGLLAGMLEFPSSSWQEKPATLAAALRETGLTQPAATQWQMLAPPVRHIFTHFELELHIAITRAPHNLTQGQWLHAEQARQLALPSLMNKVLTAAENSATSV